jgi:hypothetical protein
MRLQDLEIWQEIASCRLVSEIPPNPPLIKGGEGGFLEGARSGAKLNPVGYDFSMLSGKQFDF